MRLHFKIYFFSKLCFGYLNIYIMICFQLSLGLIFFPQKNAPQKIEMCIFLGRKFYFPISWKHIIHARPIYKTVKFGCNLMNSLVLGNTFVSKNCYFDCGRKSSLKISLLIITHRLTTTPQAHCTASNTIAPAETSLKNPIKNPTKN